MVFISHAAWSDAIWAALCMHDIVLGFVSLFGWRGTYPRMNVFVLQIT
jgi:hypothetical protein